MSPNNLSICVQLLYYYFCIKWLFYAKFKNASIVSCFQNSRADIILIFFRLLAKIKHEFPKHSLRYKLISTLNETPNELLEIAKTLSQKNFMNFVRNEILTGYRYTCEPHICHVCKRT